MTRSWSAPSHKQRDEAHSHPRSERQGTDRWARSPEAAAWEHRQKTLHGKKTNTNNNARQKQLQLPFTVFTMGDTTGRSANEEVKVCHSVHFNIIKVHFVIRSPINLKGKSPIILRFKIGLSKTHIKRIRLSPERWGCWLGCRWHYTWPTSGFLNRQSAQPGS